MKKTVMVVLLAAIISIITVVPRALAGDVPGIIIDGTATVILPESFEQNSELMVPIRSMAEALGASIEWDGAKKCIRGGRQEHSFELFLDNLQGSIDGQPVFLNQPVKMLDGQSFVPLSFLCDALGARWVQRDRTNWVYDLTIPGQESLYLPANNPQLGIIGLSQIGQGEYFSMYLDNMESGDSVTLQTNLKNRANFSSVGKTRLLLLPISWTQSPGSYFVSVKIQREGHEILWANQVIRVLPRTFRTQYLTVSAKTAALCGDDKWALDKPFWDRGLAVSTDYPLWSGPFIRPVLGRISTEFGSIRIVNKGAPSRHSGLDIAAPAGTIVQASQGGTVTLSMYLNITGNTVFIDHGCRLFSIYCHLSKINVQEGQEVKKGDPIGLVGNTGFSTGPHLHWSTQLNGVYINPALLVDPSTAPKTVSELQGVNKSD